jgi:hypothetical protein
VSGGGGVDHPQATQAQGASMYGGSLRELKKLDLFDLGVMLTIAATDGLDMVSEEKLG